MTRSLLALWVLATLGWGAGCRPAEPAPSVDTISELLHQQVARGRTPSVQYRFVGPDSVLFRHDEGVADLALGTRVSPATTYSGFSVTKTFTALAILQLAERGALRLDDPAADHLPDFPYSRDITVRQLLTHSAGIPNPVPLSWIHLREDHPSFSAETFFRPLFARHNRVKAGPNERFGYSNLGYVLLGRVIEQVSGLDYQEYVTQQVLTPLGLSAAELGFVINESTQARGYHKRNSLSYVVLGLFIDRATYVERGAQGWRAFRPYYVNGPAYGGLFGTADGFARYVQALLDPSNDLLSEESRQLLFTENILAGGEPSGMSLSWFKGDLAGHTYFAHAGGGGGYYAEIRLYPEVQRGSVILFNRSGLSDERFLDRVDLPLLAAVVPASLRAATQAR